jgi:hypothetical protein
MLVEADLMVVFVELARNGDCLLVHRLVELERILGHSVQEMRRARFTKFT